MTNGSLQQQTMHNKPLIPRFYQQEAHDAIINHWKKSVTPCVAEMATGCHEYGHPILMSNGNIKQVQDVAIGDLVMGDDGTPRKVKRLHRGDDDMYLITPTKGESFILNGGHILSLYTTPVRAGDSPGYCEISVVDYINKGATFKHRAKLKRNSIEFSYRDTPIPPYVLGAMIGDGCMTQLTPSFCNPDIECIAEIQRWVESTGCAFTKRWVAAKNSYDCYISDPKASAKSENKCRCLLDSLGVYYKASGDKFIPDIYKINSRQVRLEFLAGLLDTDGSVSRSGFDYISKSEQLADDVVYICRSLGLAAYKTECIKTCQTMSGTYYRVSISGDCSVIPNRIARKTPPKRMQKKRVDVTGFKVEKLGKGKYYGFELDGNHLYLDGYFIRHHNSGKSLVISMLARTLFNLSGGKRVLCLAPSKELVSQNAQKYKEIGEQCSIYSASISKSLRHKVVFASELTFKPVAEKLGHEFAGVIIDESHKTTKTIRDIIAVMQKANPNLRVCGLTATPYRLGDGYIYSHDIDGSAIHETKARNPFYTKLVYRIGADELIDLGYLTPLKIGAINSASYDTKDIVLQKNNKYKQSDIEKAFEGWGRETSEIVADVVAQSHDRKGVMFFAATVKHAQEIMASLPPDNARMIGGDINMSTRERDALVAAYKRQEFKYLVNVATMTTGVDFTHVDVIAVLRLTESASLFQQIIGRALRLHDGKTDALLLDYAGNVERFAPDGDIFNPTIVASKEAGENIVSVICPLCNGKNEFTGRPNPDEFNVSEDGYFVDNDGNAILTDTDKPMPSHFGRRCQNILPPRFVERCTYKWTTKDCPDCEHENDIAARYCSECKAELVNPNEKLTIAHAKHKRNPREPQCDLVESMFCTTMTSKAGNKVAKVDFTTPYRTFSTYIMLEPKNEWQEKQTNFFMQTTQNGTTPPRTVTYKKNGDFYIILGMNNQTDDEKLQNEIQSIN